MLFDTIVEHRMILGHDPHQDHDSDRHDRSISINSEDETAHRYGHDGERGWSQDWAENASNDDDDDEEDGDIGPNSVFRRKRRQQFNTNMDDFLRKFSTDNFLIDGPRRESEESDLKSRRNRESSKANLYPLVGITEEQGRSQRL